jgi:proline iminopeptidase
MLQNILYPMVEPYHIYFFQVSSLHTLYIEECGNPFGKPILYIHGGPGSSISPIHRCFFDAEQYRIILVDQRGCGKSKPFASLEENTTHHLIEDFEKIRKKLEIEQWAVFGGSWGSTLALAYAQAYPQSISDLILRGIFLARSSEIKWLYQEGANHIFPEFWQQFSDYIPEIKRNDLIAAYSELLAHGDTIIQSEAAVRWTLWEASIAKLYYDPKFVAKAIESEHALCFARIESYYLKHQCFLAEEQLLKNLYMIKSIPCSIVQGRYDLCCPMRSAYDLINIWPEAQLYIIDDAGHSLSEIGIARKLIECTKEHVNFPMRREYYA